MAFSSTYTVSNKTYKISSSNEHFSIMEGVDDTHINLRIKANCTLSNFKFNYSIPFVFKDNFRVFANGFQSNSYSKEFKKSEKKPKTFSFLKPIFKSEGCCYAGGYNLIQKLKIIKNVFISYSHIYIRELNSNTITLFGSMSDKNGYTVITANFNNNTITFTKDLEGKAIFGEYNLLDICIIKDNYEKSFNKYFSLLKIKPLTNKKLVGYSSWNNYARNINESILIKELESLTTFTKNANVFQIDDGYQVNIGDHLNYDKTKFPNGMKAMADMIHEKGLLAGIWLAPFSVTKNSQVFKEHSDWLIQNKFNKPLKIGVFFGGCYALDIYNKYARDYIKHALETISNEWTFDLFKLDILYSVACVPRNNKTRAEIMYDAIDFLRDCLKDKLIIACNTPLMPAFGKVDYCKIGCDTSKNFKQLFDFNISDEMLSTRKCIIDTIFRRYLNNRAFLSDPNAFLLNSSNCNFSSVQCRLIAEVCKIFSNVIITSDDIKQYRNEQINIFNSVVNQNVLNVLSVNILYKNTVRIDYIENSVPKLLVFDLMTSEIFREQ